MCHEVEENERVTLADKGECRNDYVCLKREEVQKSLEIIISGMTGAFSFWHPEKNDKMARLSYEHLIESRDEAVELLQHLRKA
jgi:hypothetical protein